jgi:foldase protein PrsA
MRFLREILICVMITALCGGLVACGKSSAKSMQIAASVNGAVIYESQVDEYIAAMRARNANSTSDKDWALWLDEAGYTKESLRQQVIELFIQDKLIHQAADDAGIVLDEATIDSQIQKVRTNYSTDTAWESALSASGYTEDEYRTAVESAYLSSRLKTSQVIQPIPTTAQRQAYYNSYAANYEGKRSSYILFSGEDIALAQATIDVLLSSDDLVSHFAQAANSESTDTRTSANGGDAGWDSLITLPAVYSATLNTLAVGEMTTVPVQSDYGYYVIYCSDEFTVPTDGSDVDIETVPAEIAAKLDSALASQLMAQAYSDYLTALRSKADVVIYTTSGDVVQ